MNDLQNHTQKLAGATACGLDSLPANQCNGTVLVGTTRLLVQVDQAGFASVSVGGRKYHATKYGMHGLALVKKILTAEAGQASARFIDGAIAAAKIMAAPDQGVQLKSWCSCQENTCAHQLAMLYVAAGDFTWPQTPPKQAAIGEGLALPVVEYLQRVRSVSRAVKVAHWGSQWIALVGDQWAHQDLELAVEMSEHPDWGKLFKEHLPAYKSARKRAARQNPLTRASN